jgi:hypothetical protein
VSLPGVWAVVEAGETMGRKISKGLLESSQILVKCFLGSMNTSKLVMKPFYKVKRLPFCWGRKHISSLGKSGPWSRNVHFCSQYST